ncbi:MAG: RNA polymerase sigma factor [Oscillospiraceae bacterium]|nr:RNA polymerase sigma factor [Oscillospiraceae bacterium]
MTTNEKLVSLVREILSGKPEAFDELYRLTNNTVFFHVKKTLKNEDDALDAVQDAYLVAFKNLSSLKEPESVGPWLCGIATNVALNKLRKTRREAFSLDDEDAHFELRDDSATPEESAEREATVKIISDMIETLPEEQRMATILFYYDDMSISQIAEVMGCSENTVKSRLMYARKKIEAQVRAEEKRGVKLYSASPALILLAIKWLAEKNNMPAAAAATVGGAIAAECGYAAVLTGAAAGTAAAGTAAAATSAAAGTAAAAASGIGIKIAAIAAAAALAIGGIVGGVAIARNARQSAEPTGYTDTKSGDKSSAEPGENKATGKEEDGNTEVAALISTEEAKRLRIAADFVDNESNLIPCGIQGENRYALYDLDGDGIDELCYTAISQSGDSIFLESGGRSLTSYDSFALSEQYDLSHNGRWSNFALVSFEYGGRSYFGILDEYYSTGIANSINFGEYYRATLSIKDSVDNFSYGTFSWGKPLRDGTAPDYGQLETTLSLYYDLDTREGLGDGIALTLSEDEKSDFFSSFRYIADFRHGNDAAMNAYDFLTHCSELTGDEWRMLDGDARKNVFDSYASSIDFGDDGSYSIIDSENYSELETSYRSVVENAAYLRRERIAVSAKGNLIPVYQTEELDGEKTARIDKIANFRFVAQEVDSKDLIFNGVAHGESTALMRDINGDGIEDVCFITASENYGSDYDHGFITEVILMGQEAIVMKGPAMWAESHFVDHTAEIVYFTYEGQDFIGLADINDVSCSMIIYDVNGLLYGKASWAENYTLYSLEYYEERYKANIKWERDPVTGKTMPKEEEISLKEFKFCCTTILAYRNMEDETFGAAALLAYCSSVTGDEWRLKDEDERLSIYGEYVKNLSGSGSFSLLDLDDDGYSELSACYGVLEHGDRGRYEILTVSAEGNLIPIMQFTEDCRWVGPPRMRWEGAPSWRWEKGIIGLVERDGSKYLYRELNYTRKSLTLTTYGTFLNLTEDRLYQRAGGYLTTDADSSLNYEGFADADSFENIFYDDSGFIGYNTSEFLKLCNAHEITSTPISEGRGTALKNEKARIAAYVSYLENIDSYFSVSHASLYDADGDGYSELFAIWGAKSFDFMHAVVLSVNSDGEIVELVHYNGVYDDFLFYFAAFKLNGKYYVVYAHAPKNHLYSEYYVISGLSSNQVKGLYYYDYSKDEIDFKYVAGFLSDVDYRISVFINKYK